MLFNIRGIEIDVVLPRSIAEVDRRLDALARLHNRLEDEIKTLPLKSSLRQAKGRALQETMIELQILKRWRRNANVKLENLLASTNLVNSHELRTEVSLIKHLYLELRRLNQERIISIEPGSTLATVLSAAQYWLRNYYSATLPAIELVEDLIVEEKERQQKVKPRKPQQLNQQTLGF